MAKRCTPEEMLKRLAGLKKGCEDGIRQGLIKSAAVAETQVKKNLSPGSTPYKFAPFDTGLLRGHIGYNVDVQGDEWTAMVGVEKSGNGTPAPAPVRSLESPSIARVKNGVIEGTGFMPPVREMESPGHKPEFRVYVKDGIVSGEVL